MSQIITPFQKKQHKAIVASFPRSGTHFLMNTLEKNFGYQAVPFIDLGCIEEQYFGTNIAHYLEVISIESKDPLIVKTHLEVDYFLQKATNQLTEEQKRVIDLVKVWYDIFYIYRNIGDTMESYAKHLTATSTQKNPRSNPVADSGAELAAMEPWGSPLFHQMRQYPTFKDKYEAHVRGWLEQDVIAVKYEDLNNDFDNTVRALAKRLKKPVLIPERPPRDKNVVIGASFVGT